MFCFWNAKGGAGCSVVSAALALLSGQQRPSLLVDLVGELPALLGIDVPGPGIADWLDAREPPPDALSRMEIDVIPGVALLPARGPITADGPLPRGYTDPALAAAKGDEHTAPSDEDEAADSERRFRLLLSVLASDQRLVVIDAGISRQPRRALLDVASHSILVTRSCYLSIRRAASGPCPDGVVVVREDGRSLHIPDIENAIGAPVFASLAWDPAVARAVDAGLLARRLPRPLRPLRKLIELEPDPATA